MVEKGTQETPFSSLAPPVNTTKLSLPSPLQPAQTASTAAMAPRRSLLQTLCSLLLLIGIANALKFDIPAHPGREQQKKERCIRNFVSKDTLVVVTATVGGFKGDGMQLNIHVG